MSIFYDPYDPRCDPCASPENYHRMIQEQAMKEEHMRRKLMMGMPPMSAPVASLSKQQEQKIEKKPNNKLLLLEA